MVGHSSFLLFDTTFSSPEPLPLKQGNSNLSFVVETYTHAKEEYVFVCLTCMFYRFFCWMGMLGHNSSRRQCALRSPSLLTLWPHPPSSLRASVPAAQRTWSPLSELIRPMSMGWCIWERTGTPFFFFFFEVCGEQPTNKTAKKRTTQRKQYW